MEGGWEGMERVAVVDGVSDPGLFWEREERGRGREGEKERRRGRERGSELIFSCYQKKLGNLGTILRSAWFFGFDGVITTRGRYIYPLHATKK